MNEISITKRKLNILPKNGTKFTFTIVIETENEEDRRALLNSMRDNKALKIMIEVEKEGDDNDVSGD